MSNTTNLGWFLAIAGGFGLGLILGSEFHHIWLNYIGIFIVIVTVIIIAIKNWKSK